MTKVFDSMPSISSSDVDKAAFEIDRRVLIFLLVSIGLITLPHSYHIPLPLFAFFSGLWLWRFIAIWKPDYLPNKIIIFLLTVGAVFLLYTQHPSVFGRDAGTALFVTALGLKLLEIQKERDLYLINYLAFIVASSQFLYQQNILMAGYILFVCCVLLATLIAINSQQTETLAALKTAAVITVQALPLAIVLFVIFPRMEAPRWMLFEDKHAAKTGLSDSLEPGAISRLGLSDELVFRVKFNGPIPPANQRYWRGPVYTYTDGKRWSESSGRLIRQNPNPISFSGSVYQYTVLMEPQDKKWVFALELPASYGAELNQNAYYQLLNKNNPDKRAEFKLSSYTEYNTGDLTKKELRGALQLPGQASAKVRQLVAQLQGFEQPAEVFIQAVLKYFRNENFHYTLMPPLMEENPIETFLFETRYGFCSHYATAFVYLMRVAEIPARVVGGYQGGEVNKLGGFMEIRQANAHAWAEVWLPEKGWTRFDPTAAIAPERIDQDVNIDLQIATGAVNFSPVNVNTGQAFSWMKKVGQLWGSVDYSWQRWVINYSSKSQSAFLKLLGLSDIKSMALWLVAGISFISVILAWIILNPGKLKLDKELLLYQYLCKKLAKAGFHKETGETALVFAQRIQEQRPDLAEQLNVITSIFISLRYENESSEKLLLLKKHIADLKI